jgi:hypothetical protein
MGSQPPHIETLSTAEAAAFVAQATGYEPTQATIRQWCTTGVCGQKLEHVRCGALYRIKRASLEKLVGLEAVAK